jgi:predicted ATPase
MHISYIELLSDQYPRRDVHPFNLQVFQNTRRIAFKTNVTFFVGENGSGKSTLLRAMTRKCDIHIWAEGDGSRVNYNPYEEQLHRYLDIGWTGGQKPGAFFSAETYQHMTKLIDDWASADPNLLQYFGGKSLVAQSHGESFMSFFKARYTIEGVYFLDEPETALSPRRQLEFLRFLTEMGADGHAQFVIATHSPILLSCPNARILTFDSPEIRQIEYRETEQYRVFRDFMLGQQQ